MIPHHFRCWKTLLAYLVACRAGCGVGAAESFMIVGAVVAVPVSFFAAAESGCYVDAAEAVARCAGRDGPGRAGGVPEGIAGDAGP
jgi:hypothetical protein